MASSSCQIDEKISTCAICQDLFETPKILPKCGHTFCLECLKAVWERSTNPAAITCPECRTENGVDVKTGPSGLTTNYHASQSVDALKELPKLEIVAATDTCNHWARLPHQKVVECRHCSLKFCEACLLGHKERLRLDIIWQGSELEERLERITEGLEVDISNMFNTIKDEARVTEAQIVEACEGFQQAVIAASAEHAENLISRLREICEMQLKLVESAPSNAKAQQISLSRSIVELNAKSMLHCSLEDMIAIHEKLAQQSNNEIAELESFKSRHSLGKFAFDVTQVLDSAALLMRLTSPVIDAELKWHLPAFAMNSVESKERRLHMTAKTGNEQLLKEILNRKGLPPACRKFIVEHRDLEDSNRTLLMQAAMNGHVQFVKTLAVEFEANVYATDDFQSMAIHLATEWGHLDVVHFLSSFKRDLVEVKNSHNFTPLFIAVKTGNVQMVKFFLEQMDANLECRCEGGRTPLLQATFQQNRELVKFLVEKGANVLAKDDNGDTAVHIAVSCGNTKLTKYLIDCNPGVLREKNHNRQTPFKVARSQKMNKSMQWVVFFERLKNL